MKRRGRRLIRLCCKTVGRHWTINTTATAMEIIGHANVPAREGHIYTFIYIEKKEECRRGEGEEEEEEEEGEGDNGHGNEVTRPPETHTYIGYHQEPKSRGYIFPPTFSLTPCPPLVQPLLSACITTYPGQYISSMFSVSLSLSLSPLSVYTYI